MRGCLGSTDVGQEDGSIVSSERVQLLGMWFDPSLFPMQLNGVQDACRVMEGAKHVLPSISQMYSIRGETTCTESSPSPLFFFTLPQNHVMNHNFPVPCS